MAGQRFSDDFRRFFIRGLGALVPTLLTFALVVWAYRLINDNVGFYITEGLRGLCSVIREEPSPTLVDPEEDALRYGTAINEWDDLGRRLTVEYKIINNYKVLLENKSSTANKGIMEVARRARNDAAWRIAFAKYHFHVVGFLIAIILVYFTGFFLASFLGRASWRAMEGLLKRIPIIRAVYSNIKQVTDFLLTDGTVEFSGVVAVEYPRRGVWSIGLRTGAPMRNVQRHVDEDMVTIFIPSSPTPVTGYVIQVPKKDVIDLDMTIDEALRFTISGGVIKPDGEKLALETDGSGGSFT